MQVLLLSLLIHYDFMKSKYPEHVILETLKSKARLLDIGEDMIMGWKKSSNTSFKQLNASSLPIVELDPTTLINAVDIVSSMRRINSTGRAVYDRVDDIHKQVDELKQEIIGLKRSILNIQDNFLDNSRKLDVLLGLLAMNRNISLTSSSLLILLIYLHQQQ